MLRWVVLERTARKPSARQEPCLVALPLLRRRQRSRRRVQNWSGYTLDSRSTMPLSGAQPWRQLTVANDQDSSSAGMVPVDRTAQCLRAEISLPGTVGSMMARVILDSGSALTSISVGMLVQLSSLCGNAQLKLPFQKWSPNRSYRYGRVRDRHTQNGSEFR